MTSYDSIVHQLEQSLKRHIQLLWAGDVYDADGELTQVAIVPEGLEETLLYTDKDGTERLMGPSAISIGRLQEDVINLANMLSVPSAYIEIAPNDFEQVEDWRHSIYQGLDGAANIDGNSHLFEIGSSHKMHRRFIVKMTIFFLESDQTSEEVDRLGNACGSTLEALCTSRTMMVQDWSWNMRDEDGDLIADPFGERPYRALPVIVHSRRRGGPPDNYIWDIKLYIEVQCFKEA